VAAHAALTAAVRTAEEAATERQAAVAPPAGALLLAEAAAERPAGAARDALVAHIEERCLSVEVEEWQGAATATGLVRQWLLMQVWSGTRGVRTVRADMTPRKPRPYCSWFPRPLSPSGAASVGSLAAVSLSI